MSSQDEKLLDRAIAAFLDEYKEQAEAWKLLEQKAQIGLTVSGVFVAAILAWSRDVEICNAVRDALSLSLTFLFAAFLFIMFVLQAADFELPQIGSDVRDEAMRLKGVGAPAEGSDHRYCQLLEHILSRTNEVLEGIDATNKNKVAWLGHAWMCIAAAFVFASLAAGIHLINAFKC